MQVVRLQQHSVVWSAQVDAQHIHIHIHTHTHTQARQWSKAGQIVDMQDDDVAERYYKLIGQHFDETKHFDKAER